MDTTLADPLVGQLVEGRYRVESRIARGGMAAVYLAVDTRLDRTVALKVMHRTLAGDHDFVRRFIGEARNVARLSHPNVVQVYDQGTDGDHVWLSMEYVPGRTLRDLLKERGRLGPREALELMIPVLAALGAAHQAGLVHRDVKPENVLLTEDGRVKVVDFGLARAVEATTQTKTGVLIGTIAYMSPEQVQNGSADARSDVYAAGIMLFELLTGRQPYEGDSPITVAYRHVNETVPAPSSEAPGLPFALDALVAMSTSRDPALRPSDASALLVAAVEAHKQLPANADEIARQVTVPVSRTGDTMVVAPVEYGPAAPSGRHAASALVPGRSLLFGGLVVLLIALIGGLGWWFTAGGYVHLPNYVGETATIAQQKLKQGGFQVTIAPAQHSRDVPTGKVISMDPKEHSKVSKGSMVTLIPSAGPRKIPVPDVAGKPEDQARQLVEGTGLVVADDVDREASQNVPRGVVIRTSPAAGTKVTEQGKVKLIVSIGIVLPDFRGKIKEHAAQEIQQLGFASEFVEQDNSAPAGQVIAQDPAPGTAVIPGTKIILTVSKGSGLPCPPIFCDPGAVDVPDVRGKPLNEARKILNDAGFKVDIKSTANTRRVIVQNPLGKAQPGSVVTIWH